MDGVVSDTVCLKPFISIKCEAGLNIRQAYHSENREVLTAYCNSILPEKPGRGIHDCLSNPVDRGE